MPCFLTRLRFFVCSEWSNDMYSKKAAWSFAVMVFSIALCGFFWESVSATETRHAKATASDRHGQVDTPKAARLNLRITEPTDGADVSISEFVSGTTPYADKRHYVVIIPESTPTVRWVQDGVVKVNSSGIWIGSAQFGESSLGLNENFIIRCLVTSNFVAAGRLNLQALPDDAVWSPSVKVTRTR
jgi:hypothetical protein